MRPRQDLVSLCDAGIYRVARIRRRTTEVLSSSTSHREEALGWAVIEAANLWSNFVRSYLISLCFRPSRRLGGRVAIGNLAIKSPADVVHAAAIAAKGPYAAAPTSRRDEPSWHDVSVFVRTSQRMQPSNIPQIEAALSVPSRVLTDLPVFRNFYAHRNKESAERAVGVGKNLHLIYGCCHPSDVLATRPYGRPQALILEWLDEMDAFMELLTD